MGNHTRSTRQVAKRLTDQLTQLTFPIEEKSQIVNHQTKHVICSHKQELRRRVVAVMSDVCVALPVR